VARDSGVMDVVDDQAVRLGTQLLVAGGAVLSMTLIHGAGLIGILRGLRLRPERLDEREIGFRSLMRISAFGVSLFALHLFEIGLFALFYRLTGALDGVQEALYFSASAYATLGVTEEYFPRDWRLIAALEALIGFVQISWSTAFIVSTVDRLRK